MLQAHLRYAAHESYDLAIAISEAIRNTFGHNDPDHVTGFMAMQVYGSPPHRFLEIGIADTGDGLARTRLKNPQNAGLFTSDLDAVISAPRAGISQYDDPTHGTGLHHLMQTAYQFEGSVQVRSGTGSVRFRMDKQLGWKRLVPEMPGVQIVLTAPNKGSRR